MSVRRRRARCYLCVYITNVAAFMSNLIAKLMSGGMRLFSRTMSCLMRLPVSRVDRERFLRRALKGKASADDVERTLLLSPAEVLDAAVVRRMARTVIVRHAVAVSALSFCSEFFDNLLLVALAVAFDVVQFQVHTFLVVRKLYMLYRPAADAAYQQVVHGTDGAAMSAMVDEAVMRKRLARNGLSAVGIALKQVVRRVGPGVVSRMSRVFLLNALRQLLKRVGIDVTRETVLAGIGLLIPLTCATISAAVSALLFVPMARRVANSLR